MSNYQVLFVDDDLEAATTFADLAARQTHLRTVACNSPEDAIRIVRENPIGVAVLDQRMPAMLGTELFSKLVALRPNIKAIMLSGEAGRTDVAQALALNYVADVNKGEIDKLISQIFRAHALYRRDAPTALEKPIFLQRRGVDLPFFARLEYYLTSFEVLWGPSVPEEEWVLIEQISAGQTKEVESTLTTSTEFTVEDVVESGLSADAEFKIGELLKVQKKLQGFVRSKVGSQQKAAQSKSIRHKHVLSLPPEPVDPTANAVKARGFYSGAEFVKVRLVIAKKYLPFGEEGFTWIDARVHTGRFGTRQVDILTDGSRIHRDTHVI